MPNRHPRNSNNEGFSKAGVNAFSSGGPMWSFLYIPAKPDSGLASTWAAYKQFSVFSAIPARTQMRCFFAMAAICSEDRPGMVSATLFISLPTWYPVALSSGKHASSAPICFAAPVHFSILDRFAWVSPTTELHTISATRRSCFMVFILAEVKMCADLV